MVNEAPETGLPVWQLNSQAREERKKLERDRIQSLLDENIPWEEVTYRAGNVKKTIWLAYVSGEYVRREMNRIFGWDGWSFTVPESTFRDQSVCIKGTLSVFQDEFGCVTRDALSVGTNAHGLDFASASGVTDAFKRAAATLGNRLGLQLYKQRSPAFASAWKAIGEGRDVMSKVESSDKLNDYEKEFLNHFNESMKEQL